jgi:hypothetical protein
MSRRGRIKIGPILFLAIAIYGGLFVRDAFPVVWTWMQVDEVAKVTLLEWRDKSEGKALVRMEFELAERNVPSDIVYPAPNCGERGCCLFEREKERHVDCWWDERIFLPFSEVSWVMEFQVHKYLDAENHLRDAEKPE